MPEFPPADSTRDPVADAAPAQPSGIARAYAVKLLGRFDLAAGLPPLGAESDDLHPDLEWARSGAMALTGRPNGPPLLAPCPLASGARGALLALRSLCGSDWRGGDLDAPALLGERAALFGFARRGDVSPGGSCRLIRSRDGWLAVNLARESDLELVPAWLERDCSENPWSQVVASLSRCNSGAWLERARLLGLPVADAAPDRAMTKGCDWLIESPGQPSDSTSGSTRRAPLVIDLSTLWAGPLCGHLLSRCGARVVKVESLGRPDGAREGVRDFYDLLNRGKQSVALDFQSETGLRQLRALIDVADIVIESARPRALAQLGISAEEWVTRGRGRSWLSITGYGRRDPEAGWVAFGDDAAAAAGLAMETARRHTGESGSELNPLFCADAVADPLTGLHAAVAAFASWRKGSSALLDVSLMSVTRHLLEFAGDASELGDEDSTRVRRDRDGGFRVDVGGEVQEVRAPRARPHCGEAALLGVDTAGVLDEFGIER